MLLDLLGTCDSVGRRLRRELARKNLTESGFRLLALVIRREPDAVTPAMASAALGLARPAMSALLGRLEVSGLISRERTGTDRRTFAIRVTEPGRSAFAVALRHYRDMDAQLMSALDPAAIAVLDRACVRLRQLSSPVSSN